MCGANRLAMLLLIVLLLPLAVQGAAAAAVDTTAGFTAVPLTEAQFSVQRPYDVPLEQRYEFAGGVRRMWVYCTDKPHTTTSRTKPRTEIHIMQNYSSGVWQFEGYGYVPSGTTGVSVMQVFGAPPASGHATTLMLHVYGGRLVYYRDETRVVDGDIYDRWFRLNVIHDADAAELAVFIDGDERLRVGGRGVGAVHYFKFGVYTQTDPSHRMESRWRDVRVFTKAC
ncbi:hypothetical protein ACP70R_020015 [Stipagrostis hirtigluma subsp. patula]